MDIGHEDKNTFYCSHRIDATIVPRLYIFPSKNLIQVVVPVVRSLVVLVSYGSPQIYYCENKVIRDYRQGKFVCQLPCWLSQVNVAVIYW